MIRHVVIFTWTPEATSEQISAFAAGLSTMPDKIEAIRRFEHGDDLNLGPGRADYVLVADFDTIEGYREYDGHPDHSEFVQELVKPIAAGVARVQYHVTSGE